MTRFQRFGCASVCALTLLISMTSQNSAMAASSRAQSRAQSRSHPRGFVAVDPKPIRSIRRPASASVAGQTPSGVEIHPPFQSLEFGGQTYQYFEKRNKQGGITGQTLIGKGRVEILTDREGDGVVDAWDIFTADGKMMFTYPSKGKFAFLQIEVMVAKGVMSYFYFWDPTKKSYSLYQQKGRPYKRFFLKEDFIVGCRGNEAELELEKLAEKLDRALDSGSMESELSKGLLENAIDPSCKTGDFSKYTQNLLKAMMDVAKSDKKDWSDKDAKPNEQGQYLQCMRFYGLDVQASRIEAAFAQYTSLVSDRYPWKVACSAVDDKAYGSFDEPESYTSGPTVNIHLDTAALKRANGSSLTPAKIQQSYGLTFFHEMLHYALMNEDQAHAVGDCCADPQGSPSTAACKELKFLTDDTKVKQSYENFLTERLPGGYGSFRDTLRQIWGNGNADDYFESGLLNIAHEFNEYTKQSRCTSTATKESSIGVCEAEFKAKAAKLIKDHYGSQSTSECVKSVTKKLGAAEAANTCSIITEILLSVADEGNSTDRLKQLCPQSKSTASLYSLLIPSAFAAATGAGDSRTAREALCSVASTMTKGDYVYNPKPTENQSLDLAQKIEKDTTSGQEANKNLTPSPSNSKTTYPSTNPSHPIFANDSTTRTKAIVGHLASTDSVITQFKTVAQKSFDTLIPRAQAETDRYNAQNTKQNSAQRNSREGYSVTPTAKASIPDPLTNFGANGSGGVAINDRKPAAVRREDGAGASPHMQADGGKGLESGSGGGGHLLAGKDADPNLAQATSSKDEKGAKESTREPAKRKLSPPEERALEALKTFLQNNNYAKVKKDLDRPSVEGALLDHAIQVVDDEGRVHGSGFPDYNFKYDAQLGRLAPDQGSTRRPASKKK